MKSLIIDNEALLAVSPLAVSAFARKNGWLRQEQYRDHADVYSLGQSGGLTLVPRTKQIVDYADIVSNLLSVFSEQLGRDQDEIYRKLVDAENDVFRIRALEADEDGTIDVEGGVDLISHAKDALLAAACSISAPQPVYRPGANREASDFMKTVRLGQTGHGSFIVNLLNKVPPQLQPSLIDDWGPFADEPIERKVSRKLSEALLALRTSAEQANGGVGLASFESSVKLGVSANLCDALSKMITAVDDVELSIDWAETRPAPESTLRVKFSDDDGAIFREAARKLREKRPRPNVFLYGVVNKLSRAHEEDDGTVTLKVDIDGTIQSVAATLDQSNYDSAVDAHGRKFPVVATGDLERIGSRWRLINAAVRVLEASVDEEDSAEEGHSNISE